LWAEKEFRNLHRIYSAYISSPKPLYVRQNVLLMRVIGRDGIAAPRLKDYEFNTNNGLDSVYDCYLQIIKAMRLLYWKCNLIHGDLSEYNILYCDGLAYIIDVSQSVEPQHPNSYQFLAKDCKNVNDFFRRKGIMTLSDLELFEYILDERHLRDLDVKGYSYKKWDKRIRNVYQGKDASEKEMASEYVFCKENAAWNDVIDCKLLTKIENVCKERWDAMVNNEDEVGDAVHLQSKIMTSLFQIDDSFQIHKNTEKYKQISKFLMKGELDITTQIDKFDDVEQESAESESDSSDVEIEEEEENEMAKMVMFPKTPQDLLNDKKSLSKDELKEIRKANKKIVKAANRERRKHKLPKRVKKRKIKVARIKAGKTIWKG